MRQQLYDGINNGTIWMRGDGIENGKTFSYRPGNCLARKVPANHADVLGIQREFQHLALGVSDIADIL